jgi:uncharacterized protein
VGSWGLYIAFLIPPLLIGLGVQWWLKKTFAEQAQVHATNGMTGAQVARAILDANGLQDVPVTVSPGGPLSDHYDPRKRAVFLSPPVYEERSAMFPAVAFSSSIWLWLLMAGFLLQITGLALVAIALYAVAVLFHFVTLPVEFDASRRAGVQLQNLGLVTAGEAGGVKKVLNAAAMTYVAGALAALTQLLYFALMFLGDD